MFVDSPELPTQRREEANQLIYEITNSCQDVF